MKPLNEMTGPELEASLVPLLKKFDETGDEYAEAKSIYENLDEDKKPLLAEIGKEVDGSEASRTSHSLSSKEYEVFRKGLQEARTLYNKALVSWIKIQKKVDLWQTLMANRRQEVKSFKG